MAAFYSAADLFVVGSHHEGSGYSLMEACACGAMPVVTDIPTFRLLTAAERSARCGRSAMPRTARARSSTSRGAISTRNARGSRITSRAS